MAEAEEARSEHERRLRVDNAEALMEAKNDRTARAYMDGILDTDAYLRLAEDAREAELSYYEARCEVDRLQLTVKLLQATVSPGA